MILKQRPFCDPDLATAVNSALTRKINLDQFVELQDSHALNLGESLSGEPCTGACLWQFSCKRVSKERFARCPYGEIAAAAARCECRTRLQLPSGPYGALYS